MQQDDNTLLLAMRDGDHAAGEVLWSMHAPRLAAFVAAMLGSHSSSQGIADDAVQTVFLRLLKTDRAVLVGVCDVRAYLTKAARNAVLNFRRSEKRESVRYEALTPHDDAQCQGPIDSLGAMVDSLPEQQREAIVLKHVAGLTFDQMSRVTGEPRATLASRYAAALCTLRERIEPADATIRTGAHAP